MISQLIALEDHRNVLDWIKQSRGTEGRKDGRTEGLTEATEDNSTHDDGVA